MRQDRGGDAVPFVTIQVTGDKDQFKGPYTAKTNEKGDYTILITELTSNVDGVEFKAEVIGGPGVNSKDKPKWTVDDDCKKEGAIQVMEIDWERKDPD